MCCLVVGFAACNDDKSENSYSQLQYGGSSNSDANGKVSAVSVFKSGTQDGHDYVDLGLTSGTKWATANVGAKTPQDCGNYYAWGETTTKDYYDRSNYKFGTYYDGDYSKLTKYNSNSKTTLDLSDDAAYANWGGKWRMPTMAQQEELLDECYWVWTDSYNDSNVKGYIVYKAKNSSDKGVKIYEDETPSSSYSLSDAHIFLPVSFTFPSISGYYWSSSLDDNGPTERSVYFDSDYVGCNEHFSDRYYGQSVRAVFK